MAVYINVPTIDIDYLRPKRFSFDTQGGGLEGGRNGLGEGITIGLSGGPIVTASYQECFTHYREQHEYVNWIAARLNGSFRFVNVPLLTDWVGPFPVDANGGPEPIISEIPHSDGSTFSDGSGYSQPTVWGEVTEAATYNAGVIKFQLFGAARLLRHSDWFSIYNETKGWRASRPWEIRDINDPSAESPIYTVAIDVPLREAITVGQRLEFARPRCVMKFPAGFTLPQEAEGFWVSEPTLQFTEAF
ncbi:hypothetical protein [Allomesorhizobium alhagi]|uniref:Uncharacterized protein n=1 Tax=Mesorhizobium alhagi CCNWXJ12-2 TaxID=1107882 RepID=H0HQT2_9HYPH|nr:hypothetical protein [Mesorhizobium alhagi]EHK56896.1 hypothetical protein MAXJ12_12562 [Mesorhizobium alhagi CCNWXJ12-2]